MKAFFKVCVMAITIVGLGLPIGCSKKDEGPMEKAGKKIDEAAKKTGEAVKEGA